MDFEKLYHMYYASVYSYVMKVMKNSDQAEEITQEVFYKALKTRASFQKQSGEFTWLCAIAKNACMDEFRRQSKQGKYQESEPQSTNLNIETLLVNNNTSFAIHEILHSMEEPYKEVFQLRVFGELGFYEIGKLFAKTDSWARVTYHRARLKIKERMKNYE
ncbi:RNA polymerase sigma factor [Anaerocolumna sp. MB42-C2]|uniref:RNA polymerase sigma factor n=1 Tax=Anaerocolumna sp. MB42-C2 TaxID=3070997 RepID=UPI0027DF0C98|nr:sigma-70 family RNA polymerase sigma factor [Anaerocolumna sp. MB42-C2]WMJ89226.1 sigma-70 family RNA polymerase sigma factor [Anaerocolumna sp. MB42-C2]